MRVGALDGGSDLQEEALICDCADELEADGQASGGEAAGNRYCGNSCKIGGAVGTEEKGAGGIILVGEADGFLADERGRDGGGWNRDSIDPCIFQCYMELLEEFMAKIESREVDRCGDLSSHF